CSVSAFEMATFYYDVPGTHLVNLESRFLHVINRPDSLTRQHVSFINIWSYEKCEREKRAAKDRYCIRLHQRRAGRGDHYRIDDEISNAVLLHFVSDNLNNSRSQKHPGLGGVWRNIRENSVQLPGNEIRRNFR